MDGRDLGWRGGVGGRVDISGRHQGPYGIGFVGAAAAARDRDRSGGDDALGAGHSEPNQRGHHGAGAPLCGCLCQYEGDGRTNGVAPEIENHPPARMD